MGFLGFFDRAGAKFGDFAGKSPDLWSSFEVRLVYLVRNVEVKGNWRGELFENWVGEEFVRFWGNVGFFWGFYKKRAGKGRGLLGFGQEDEPGDRTIIVENRGFYVF